MSIEIHKQVETLDSQWFALCILGMNGSGDPPFPLENERGQEEFRTALLILARQLAKIIEYYDFPSIAPPIDHDREKLRHHEAMLSEFLPACASAVCATMVRLVPEFLRTSVQWTLLLTKVHGNLMGVALNYFPLSNVIVEEADSPRDRIPPDRIPPDNCLAIIEVHKAAVTRISNMTRAAVNEWGTQVQARARNFYIDRAFGGSVSSSPTTTLDEPPIERRQNDNDKEGGKSARERTTSKVDPIAIQRTSLLNDYVAQCKARGVKITDKMIAKAARPSWNERTPVQRWKRNDPKSTHSDDQAIRRVLTEKPHLK